MVIVLWLALLHLSLFVLGCCVGSFLNVCIHRMATGRSIAWPSSHCGSCYRELPSRYNVPLVTYLVLGGRCAFCGATFSARYFFVELLTGLIFTALLAVDVGWNWQNYPIWNFGGYWYFSWGVFPPYCLPLWLARAFLACLLIVAVGSLADTGRVPPTLALSGAVVGTAWALLFPWPEPRPFPLMPTDLVPGFLLWPAWYPLLPGEPFLSALAGTFLIAGVIRLVESLRRKPLLGQPPVAVALMCGGFLGWQVEALALLLAGLITLRGRSARPGARLALGFALMIPVVWLAWPVVGPFLRPVFFHPLGASGLLGATALVLALQRGGSAST